MTNASNPFRLIGAFQHIQFVTYIAYCVYVHTYVYKIMYLHAFCTYEVNTVPLFMLCEVEMQPKYVCGTIVEKTWMAGGALCFSG